MLFQDKRLGLKIGKIGDKKQAKYHILETFCYMVSTRNQIAKVFVYVVYKYDMD